VDSDGQSSTHGKLDPCTLECGEDGAELFNEIEHDEGRG
jgi:hypothetical protein